MGLRELKKEQTRAAIADTAWQLFIDRGFDQVSVAEVARAAQVAEATVFNYFPSKENLFYSRLESFWTRLADSVSARPDGQPVLDAFRHGPAGREWPARPAGIGRPGRADPAAHGEPHRGGQLRRCSPASSR